jgi:hypothetical protein
VEIGSVKRNHSIVKCDTQVQGSNVSHAGRLDYLTLAALAIAASAALAWATSGRGVGVSPDSTVYLHAARSLAQGQGLNAYSRQGGAIPLTHYPPLLPVVLGLLSLSGLDSLEAARWLDVLAYGASALLLGILLYRSTRNRWAALCGQALWLSSLAIVTAHSMVWTEPSFILLSWVSLASLAAHLSRPRYLWLIVGGLSAGLAMLDRYVGGALVLTGAVALLLFAKARWRTRLADAVVFSAVAGAGTLAWLVRNHFVAGGNLTNRQFAFHPPGLSQVAILAQTLSDSMPVPPWLQPVALAVLAAAILVAIWRTRPSPRNGEPCQAQASPSRLPEILGVYIPAYLTVMTLTQIFFDAAVKMDDRSVALISGPMIFLLVLLARRVVRLWKPGILRNALVAVACLAVVGVYSVRARQFLLLAHHQGLEYRSLQWEHSPLVAQVRYLPRQTVIYSNKIDAVLFLTGRRAVDLPARFDEITRRPIETYQDDMTEMLKTLRESHGVIVYFEGVDWGSPPDKAALEQNGLRAAALCDDGVLYRLGNP